LNPVQELLQPEGSPRFRGVLEGIAMLVKGLPVPVMVKETGSGLSPRVVQTLLDAGVRIVDVAGAGGTSWGRVEMLRRRGSPELRPFGDWGIPTARAVRGAAMLKGSAGPFTLIASGGIESGLDAAKCIALGADLVAAARPLLLALVRRGPGGLRTMLEGWRRALVGAMFLTGSRTIGNLQHAALEETDPHGQPPL
ncbi:MAG: alpha-hydroxy-acid oxidizing protein, partial [Bacteroidota bacterium]